LAAEPAGGSQAGAHAETAQPENPILPTGPELVWGAATFLVLWALMKYVLLKPILKTMEDRAEKVRTDLETADSAKAQGQGAVAEYEASLASARVEATRIIEEARAEAEAQRKQLIAAVEAEVGELRSAANAEVNQAKAQALQTLRESVATIAVQAAEAVVQKRLDETAQRRIVEEYLSRVGSQN
jgi:F-type H+-transporting ATPase subunit b